MARRHGGSSKSSWAFPESPGVSPGRLEFGEAWEAGLPRGTESEQGHESVVLPMLELWNWGEKGLIDSELERGGQPPLGSPLLFPHISFRARVEGEGDWWNLESRSGVTESEQTGLQPPGDPPKMG